MKAVLQRVSSAQVTVEGEITGSIGLGLLILLGVEHGDSEEDCRYMSQKMVEMRIFGDENGKMNKSIKEVAGAILLISQFTLMADWKKGRRPAFTAAGEPKEANRLYEYFAQCLRDLGLRVETGVFAAHMDVQLVNDGPVTIIMENQLPSKQ